MQGPVPDKGDHRVDATIDRMLGMVDRARYQRSRDGGRRTIAIAGTTIMFDPSAPSFKHRLERLASAIEGKRPVSPALRVM